MWQYLYIQEIIGTFATEIRRRAVMKTVNQIIGENLKKIRELSGLHKNKIERSTYSNYEGGTREIPYTILEDISNLFGCEPFILFEDNVQTNNEIMATAFRISNLGENDLKEIAAFKDIVKSYLKMERIAQNEAE